MSERDRVIHELTARAKATGQALYGYASAKADCQRVTRDVPAEWDRLCVEGDRRWTVIPVKEAAKG